MGVNLPGPTPSPSPPTSRRRFFFHFAGSAEREERLAQLRLYRRAYQARSGVPAELIDVVLYYVADDLVIRD